MLLGMRIVCNYIDDVYEVVGMLKNFRDLKVIKEKDYINKMVDKINYKVEDTKQKMEKIRNLSNAYIEEKISSIE